MNKPLPPRVVELAPPAMNESEFQVQLGRYTTSLARLDSPEQQRRNHQHPGLARAAGAMQSAFRLAADATGSDNATTYHTALVAVRRAVANWIAADARHGDIAVRPVAS